MRVQEEYYVLWILSVFCPKHAVRHYRNYFHAILFGKKEENFLRTLWILIFYDAIKSHKKKKKMIKIDLI